MDEAERDALRRQLLTYPGIHAGNVEEHIWRYEERATQKAELLGRGFSNRLAEKWLDGSGYPRPRLACLAREPLVTCEHLVA